MRRSDRDATKCRYYCIKISGILINYYHKGYWSSGMRLYSKIIFLFLAIVASPLDAFAEVKSIVKSDGLVWAGCGITKKAFMAEVAKAYQIKTGIEIKLQGGGATKGIRGVTKGTINIGGACRASMEFHKDERYVNQIPVAWDAIVFVVNKNNPVDNISMDQVRAIYNGKITNWSQLGGKNLPIELYVRKSPISGVGQTLRELVFHDTQKKFTKRAHVVKSSGPAEKAVVKMEAAFTATGVSSANRRDVKILKVAGTSPTYENIKSGEYMLYRPLYLVTKLRETNPYVTDFINYVTSNEGKEIIRKAGTVPYTDALHLLSKKYTEYKVAIEAGI